VIERRLQIRFGEVERPRADVLGGRLQGVCGAFRLRGCLVSGLKAKDGARAAIRRSNENQECAISV
jgi:hypothetical protein